MQIEVLKNELAGALSALGKLVVRTSPVELFRSLRIEGKGDTLSFQTTSINETITCTIPADGAGEFSVIVPIFKEFQHPRHEEFAEPTRWSLLNAFTEHAKKYSPGRADVCYRGLTQLFGLDGNRAELWQ